MPLSPGILPITPFLFSELISIDRAMKVHGTPIADPLPHSPGIRKADQG
jgi:hypothetical protein